MRSSTWRLEDLRNVILNLGFVGENLHTRQIFDCKKMFDQYPNASVNMTVTPPEGEPYPGTIERDGNLVIWDVRDSDLVAEGDGEIQLVFTQEPHIARSYNARTHICRSQVPTGSIPSGLDDYITRADQLLDQVEDTFPAGGTTGQVLAKKSNADYDTEWVDQGAGGTSDYDELENRPQIGGVTLTGNKTLHDLGAAAESDIPDLTDLIDDTAGAGDMDKVWSADKSHSLLTQINSNTEDIEDIEIELHGQETTDTKSVNPDAEWSVGGVQASVGSPIAFSSSSSYRYTYYNIDESDIEFNVTTYQSTSQYYPKYVHFVNSSGTVLSAVGNIESTAGYYTYNNIPIPEGAVKMYVTYNGTQPSLAPNYSVTKKYYSANIPGIAEKVDTLVTDVAGLKANVGEPEIVQKSVQNKNIVNGGLKGETGGSLSTTVSSSYNNVTVNVDDDANKYIIRMKQSTSSNYPHYFWFVNANGIILLAGGEIKESDGHYTYTVESIPSGSKTLSVLTAGGSDNIIIKKEVIISIRSEMDDIEHYFDKKGLSTSPYADQLKDDGRATVFGYNFSRKCLNFAFITDTHFGGTRYPEYDARNNMRAFADMANERWLDFAAHGGDIITDYGLSRDEAIEWMDDTLGIFGDIQIPVLIAKGNHEANSAYYQLVADTSNLDWEHTTYYVRDGISFAETTENDWNGEDDLYVSDATPERIPDIQFTMLAQLGFAGDVVRNASDYLGGYFYKDFDYNKIRVIVLDEYQIRGTTWVGMSSEQLAWLGGTALVLGDKADYSVMIISHSPNVSADVVGLINAYQNGTSYTISGTTYDFTSQGAKDFIMYLHGHEHNDTLVTTDGFNNIGVLCGFVPAEKVETEEEIRFSIFTIDTTEKKIYETRIGYGNSREFDY